MGRTYLQRLDVILKNYHPSTKLIKDNKFFMISFEIGLIGTFEESLINPQYHKFTNSFKKCFLKSGRFPYVDRDQNMHKFYIGEDIPKDVLENINKVSQHKKTKWLRLFKPIEYDECVLCGSSGYARLVFEKKS